MTLTEFWYVLVACYFAFIIGCVTVGTALLLLLVRSIVRSIK